MFNVYHGFRTRTVPSHQQHVSELILSRNFGFCLIHSIFDSYYKRAEGVVLVYDVTNSNSFNSIIGWLKDIKNMCSEHVKIILGIYLFNYDVTIAIFDSNKLSCSSWYQKWKCSRKRCNDIRWGKICQTIRYGFHWNFEHVQWVRWRDVSHNCICSSFEEAHDKKCAVSTHLWTETEREWIELLLKINSTSMNHT